MPEAELTFESFYQNLNTNYTKQYDVDISNVVHGLNRRNDVVTHYDNLIYSIETAADYTTLLDYLNPSSDLLFGKSYNDFILDSITKHFITNNDFTYPGVDNDENVINSNKKRVEGAISIFKGLKLPKVVNNILGVVVNSNPITQLVGNVLGGISSCFKVGENLDGPDSIIPYDSERNSTQLKEVMKDLNVYIEFYDEALRITRLHSQDLERLKSDSKYIQNEVRILISEIMKEIVDYTTDDYYYSENSIKNLFEYDIETYLVNSSERGLLKILNISNEILKLEKKCKESLKTYKELHKQFLIDITDLMDETKPKQKSSNANFDKLISIYKENEYNLDKTIGIKDGNISFI